MFGGETRIGALPEFGSMRLRLTGMLMTKTPRPVLVATRFVPRNNRLSASSAVYAPETSALFRPRTTASLKATGCCEATPNSLSALPNGWEGMSNRRTAP